MADATVRTQLEAIIRQASGPRRRLSYAERMRQIEGLARAAVTMLDNSREMTKKDDQSAIRRQEFLSGQPKYGETGEL